VGDETAAVLGAASRGTPRGPNGIAVTEAVLEVVRGACTDAGIAPTEAVAAGIGSIGPLDLAEGVVQGPANLPDTVERIPLVGPVGRLLDTDEVYLHN
ncbi:ROK family protein, partial [Halorubrum sp. SS5]